MRKLVLVLVVGSIILAAETSRSSSREHSDLRDPFSDDKGTRRYHRGKFDSADSDDSKSRKHSRSRNYSRSQSHSHNRDSDSDDSGPPNDRPYSRSSSSRSRAHSSSDSTRSHSHSNSRRSVETDESIEKLRDRDCCGLNERINDIIEKMNDAADAIKNTRRAKRRLYRGMHRSRIIQQRMVKKFKDFINNEISCGLKGPTGPAGSKGEVGPPGDSGAEGRPGRDGRDGVAYDGKPGQPGKDGEDGAPGKSGKLGRPGNQKRPKGKHGIIGNCGPVGSDGQRGMDGHNGKDGPKGLNGPQGNPGSNNGISCYLNKVYEAQWLKASPTDGSETTDAYVPGDTVRADSNFASYVYLKCSRDYVLRCYDDSTSSMKQCMKATNNDRTMKLKCIGNDQWDNDDVNEELPMCVRKEVL